MEISASGAFDQADDPCIIINIKNNSDNIIQIDELGQAITNRDNRLVMLVSVENDDRVMKYEDTGAIEDPANAILEIEANRSITFKIMLGNIFHTNREMLKRDNVYVFWVFKFVTKSGVSGEAVGGWKICKVKDERAENGRVSTIDKHERPEGLAWKQTKTQR